MRRVTEQLEALIAEYGEKFQAIPATEFVHKPLPNKWSKKEIIGHLIDSAQNNIQRFVRAQYQDKPLIVYNQDAWVAATNYQAYERESLIQLWQLLNKHICIILASMPKQMYAREVNIGGAEQRLVTVQFLADDYITHHLHHIKQIFNN